jgi:quercetin dioxygenase-like cupin family protein
VTIIDPATATPTAPAVSRHANETPARWFLNGLMTTLATKDETNGAYCVMEQVITAASNPPVHLHTVEDEAFYVLEGEIEFVVGGESIVGRPGSYAFVPRGVDHSFLVRSAEARVLVVTSGDAPEGGAHAFFEAAGSPAPARRLPTPEAPDPAALAALAEPRGIVLLGPPPA